VVNGVCFFIYCGEVRHVVKEELVALFLPNVFFHSVWHIVNAFNAGKSIEFRLFADVFLINLVNIHETVLSSSHEILLILVKFHGCDPA
jgi:hypothetical protein